MSKKPKNLWDEALKEGREKTFTNAFKDNWLGDLGRWVNSGTAKIPLLKLAVPFVRTPTNIANFALERTPFALTLRDTRKVLFGPKSVARDQAWAKIVTGTGAGWVAAWAAQEGLITGGAPTDRAERQIREAAGFQEYSFVTPRGHIAFGRIEPLGMIMGGAADMARASDLLASGESDQIAALISASVFKNLSSKTFLRGLNDMVKAINEPDRYAGRFVQNLVTSTIPFSSLIAAGSRANDPIFRESSNIVERAQARGIRLFGSSEDLPARRNIWGQPVRIDDATEFLNVDPEDNKRINSLINGALRFTNPIYMRSKKDDKVTNFMINMGYFPGLPSERMQGVKLKKNEWSRYVQLAGEPAKDLLDKRAASREWDEIVTKGSLEDRADLVEFIEDVIYEFRSDARDKLLAEFPELRQRIEEKRREDEQRFLQEQ